MHGFVLIIVVVGVGYVASRVGIVRGERRRVLNDVSFYIATPPLLFTMLSGSDPAIIVSPVIFVIALAALTVAAAYVAFSVFLLKQDLATATIGAAASGYVNSNNLGLPIALYILGEVTYVAPVILVQQLIFSPVILAILEATRDSNHVGASAESRKSQGRNIARALGRTLKNPIIIACVLGFVFASFDITVPEIIFNPLAMIGAAAVPMILMSLGMSLHGQRVLQPGSDKVGVLIATSFKMLLMPLVSWVLALLFGLGSYETFVAVTFGALPTAQMIYNYAVIYGRAETLARDTALITTFVALPVIVVVAFFLAT